MQHITVVPYDPAWPGLYEAEAQAIAGVLGQRLTAIHHIGSTAVPGLAAKPVIDIMPVVRAVTEADECRADFEALGYEYLGEFGIPGRRYLRNWPCRIICAPIPPARRLTARSSWNWRPGSLMTSTATATARTPLLGRWSATRWNGAPPVI